MAAETEQREGAGCPTEFLNGKIVLAFVETEADVQFYHTCRVAKNLAERHDVVGGIEESEVLLHKCYGGSGPEASGRRSSIVLSEGQSSLGVRAKTGSGVDAETDPVENGSGEIKKNGGIGSAAGRRGFMHVTKHGLGNGFPFFLGFSPRLF